MAAEDSRMKLAVHYFWCFLVWLTSPIFRWLYEDNRRNLPAVRNPLIMKSAVELGRLIRLREVKSVDVVKAFIDRIRVVNMHINAVVADRFEAALDEAAAIDNLLDSGDIPDEKSEANAPFLGVPFTTKEAISVKGMPNTSGLLVRQGIVSEKDADGVACLRHAGGIPIAVTNCSELCMWYESSNLVYGRCKNAYHMGRMVGGSSGGEGCIQTAGGSPMGIGSDIGGSIRMPSFFNGVFGHKCSTGLVSNAGQFPNAKGDGQIYLSTGPMSRFASDLLPMFKVMVLPNQKQRLRLDEKADVKRLKYFYMEDDGGALLVSPVHKQIKKAIKDAAAHFEQLGCNVEKISLSEMRFSQEIWVTMMNTSGGDTFCAQLGPDLAHPINPLIELLLWFLGQRRHTLPAIGLGLFEKIKASDEEIAALRKKRDELKAKLIDLLGDDGVLLYPTHPIPAPYHNQAILLLYNFAYTGIFNVLGLPVTAVPMGLANDEGVPIGIQAVAAPYCDRLTLAVASELETAFCGWVPPFESQVNV